VFGLFVRRLALPHSILFAILILARPCFPKENKVYKGKVLTESALVYKAADFDSAVLGTVSAGVEYEISRRAFGPFHRIRIGKKIGYIADNDIQPIGFSFENAASGNAGGKSKKADKKEPEKRKRSFALSRYVGPAFASINFTESTMGRKLSESEIFYGLKMSGTDVLVSGDATTEINLMFYYGAPGYYERFTGQAATGWNFLSDFQFHTVSTLSPIMLGFYGFGPMFRFSKFELAVKDGAVVNRYMASEMILGAAFSGGIAIRLGSVALRSEFKYYWEKTQYSGINAALQFEF
jgi:hypothetical protein